MKSILGLFSRLPLLAAIIISMTSHVCGAAAYKVLHNFGSGADGFGPYGPPLLDNKGNLYGVTAVGGTGQCSDYGCGTVFALYRSHSGGWKEAILHSFTAGSDGALPWGGLIFDHAGDIYGTVVGDNGLGGKGVFRLSPDSQGWSNTVLYDKGSGPGLLMDNAGNLYGDIGPGDYYGAGAIGKLSSASNGWVYAQLYSYCGPSGCPNGDGEPAPPIWDGKGNLFGTTTDGGIAQPACWTSFGCGVIFEMTPSGDGTWTYHVLHRFASYPTDGQTPYGGLVMDASGNFYGTTEFGGDKTNGTVFKLAFTHGHWKKTVVWDFPDWHEGALPNSTLVVDKAGNLYGIGGGGNQGCGPYTCGVVFKLTPQKTGQWKYSAVHKFSGQDGNFPIGVIVDGKGNLFGTTSAGGTYNSGVAFEITP
jgi:uncharacterized repeat protein (TIGR03803 family)